MVDYGRLHPLQVILNPALVLSTHTEPLTHQELQSAIGSNSDWAFDDENRSFRVKSLWAELSEVRVKVTAIIAAMAIPDRVLRNFVFIIYLLKV